jgi:hypothetical protein
MGCLLATGAPSITKNWVAPESAMTSVGGGRRQVLTRARWLVVDMEVLDVTMVASSSSWMDERKVVGYGKVVVSTSNDSKHLNASFLIAAPNHHMFVGNSVLCLFLVEHGCPKSMYCWAFWRVK